MKLLERTFNIASPKQLGIILFEKLKLVDKPKENQNRTVQYGRRCIVLFGKRPRNHSKCIGLQRSCQTKKHLCRCTARTSFRVQGTFHTEYMQTVAATGRLSSNNPNLQNIPIRTERGRQVRKAFVPRNEGVHPFSSRLFSN